MVAATAASSGPAEPASTRVTSGRALASRANASRSSAWFLWG